MKLFDIRDFGAVPGEDCREAMTRALEAAEEVEDGIVHVPTKGNFFLEEWHEALN